MVFGGVGGASTYSGLGGATLLSSGLIRGFCSPYQTSGAATCSTTENTANYGTFSYIDAVYGSGAMESNYLCNGLANGGAYFNSRVCYTLNLGSYTLNGWQGFVPGTAAAYYSMQAAQSAYCASVANSGTFGCNGNNCW